MRRGLRQVFEGIDSRPDRVAIMSPKAPLAVQALKEKRQVQFDDLHADRECFQ
jgi:hypothetical protein